MRSSHVIFSLSVLPMERGPDFPLSRCGPGISLAASIPFRHLSWISAHGLSSHLLGFSEDSLLWSRNSHFGSKGGRKLISFGFCLKTNTNTVSAGARAWGLGARGPSIVLQTAFGHLCRWACVLLLLLGPGAHQCRTSELSKAFPPTHTHLSLLPLCPLLVTDRNSLP